MFRAICLSVLFSLSTTATRADDVVVFAASSLKGALDEVLQGTQTRVSYGGSGVLARQITQGAPADIFLSANPRWMDAVASRVSKRADLLANTLVIVSRDHAALKDEGRVAMGLVASVPAGIYGKAYLEASGQWDAIVPRVIETDSARAALALAAKGEVAYALVYETDALAVPELNIVQSFPPSESLPVLYPVALLDGAKPEALGIYETLFSTDARAVFDRHGFTAP